MQQEALLPFTAVPPGRYRHYKGGMYQVLNTARHSETLEPMVVYRALYGDCGLWVRPAAMLGETVVFEGQAHTRFVKVEDESTGSGL